jgi:hypothetical protein
MSSGSPARFSSVDEHDDHGHWSTPEEERTFRAVRDLLMEMYSRGSGIYIRPVREDERHGVDGWVVGELTSDGSQDLAVGPWLGQVVEAARAAAD